jgi:hypothetical protein
MEDGGGCDGEGLSEADDGEDQIVPDYGDEEDVEEGK